MSWNAHIDFFEREIERLSREPFALGFQSFLEALGLDGVSETDAAIHVFARTLEWPQFSDRIRFEICLRLSCARWYCADMVASEGEAGDEHGTEFLESLLIEYWRDTGRSEWLYRTFVQSMDSSS